jgi:hypothetical protein
MLRSTVFGRDVFKCASPQCTHVYPAARIFGLSGSYKGIRLNTTNKIYPMAPSPGLLWDKVREVLDEMGFIDIGLKRSKIPGESVVMARHVSRTVNGSYLRTYDTKCVYTFMYEYGQLFLLGAVAHPGGRYRYRWYDCINQITNYIDSLGSKSDLNSRNSEEAIYTFPERDTMLRLQEEADIRYERDRLIRERDVCIMKITVNIDDPFRDFLLRKINDKEEAYRKKFREEMPPMTFYPI